MKKFIVESLLAIVVMLLPCKILAAPETVGVQVTDVTTSSFSVVWMTDIAASPSLDVSMDRSMSILINDSIKISPMGGISEEIAEAAKNKGLMKAVAVGLDAGKTYYVRSVTRNPVNQSEVSYSTVLEVTTAQEIRHYKNVDGISHGFSNDVNTFTVHVRPSDAGDNPSIGDIIILQTDGASYPVSAFVGGGVTSPKGLIDLNNVFGNDGMNMDVIGGERLTLKVYNGDLLYSLIHFRKVKTDSNLVYVVEPDKGFFADINIDGSVDDADFEYFKEQYRTLPDDENYNPDYNFVADTDSSVDVREFSKFALEYGRTGVE